MANETKNNETPDSCLLKDTCLFKASGLYKEGERLSADDLRRLRWIVSGVLVAVILITGVSLFFMLYPFKTVVFTQPIEILNPGKRVSINGVVSMKIHYRKYINNKGLVIRTLIHKKGNEITVIDSSTVVSTRPAGAGVTEAYFPLNSNSFAVGKDCQIIFSIYYTLFGVRNEVMQYETEPFEIYQDETPGKGKEGSLGSPKKMRQSVAVFAPALW